MCLSAPLTARSGAQHCRVHKRLPAAAGAVLSTYQPPMRLRTCADGGAHVMMCSHACLVALHGVLSAAADDDTLLGSPAACAPAVAAVAAPAAVSSALHGCAAGAAEPKHVSKQHAELRLPTVAASVVTAAIVSAEQSPMRDRTLRNCTIVAACS